MSEYKESIEDLKNRSALMKELGRDILNTTQKLDNLINYLEDPLAMILSNDMKGDLEKLENELKISIAMVTNKSEVIADLFKEEE